MSELERLFGDFVPVSQGLAQKTAITDKFADTLTNAATSFADFTGKLMIGDSDFAASNAFQAHIDAKKAAYEKLGTTVDGVFKLNEGVKQETADAAKTALDNAREGFKNLLTTGSAKIDKKTYTVSGSVKDAFVKAQEATTAVTGTASGFLGRIKTQGFKSAAKQGGSEILMRNGGSFKTAAMRGGSVVVGAALVAHSFKSTNKHGEKRSKLARFVELVVGGVVGVLGVTAGPALAR